MTDSAPPPLPPKPRGSPPSEDTAASSVVPADRTRSTSGNNTALRIVASSSKRGLEWSKRKGTSLGKVIRHRSASTPPPTLAPPPTTTVVLGIRVPINTTTEGVVFGRPLKEATRATRMISPEKQAQLVLQYDERTEAGLRKRERTEANAWLPAIAIRCLEYVESFADKEEGLYRIPGSAQQVQQLKLLFNSGMDLDLRTKKTRELDPHSVTSVFKLWLRELPEPILTSGVGKMLDRLLLEDIGALATGLLHSQDANTKDPPQYTIDKMSILLSTLPLERWHLLREIAAHLAYLDGLSHINKMTLSNLRLILSPTLHLSPAMLQLLVEHRRVLFDKERAHAIATPSPTMSPAPDSIRSPSLSRPDSSATFQSSLHPPRNSRSTSAMISTASVSSAVGLGLGMDPFSAPAASHTTTFAHQQESKASQDARTKRQSQTLTTPTAPKMSTPLQTQSSPTQRHVASRASPSTRTRTSSTSTVGSLRVSTSQPALSNTKTPSLPSATRSADNLKTVNPYPETSLNCNTPDLASSSVETADEDEEAESITTAPHTTTINDTPSKESRSRVPSSAPSLSLALDEGFEAAFFS